MSDAERRAPKDERLARVLGPAAPELSCEECFAQLDRYVDLGLSGEAADERVPGMRAHLAGCPACAEDFRSLRDFVAAEHGPPRGADDE
jgi:anti-sigma factor RsiW